MRWAPYGEAAIYIDLGIEAERAGARSGAPTLERAARTHAAAALLRAKLPSGAAAEVIIGAGAFVVAGIDPGARAAVATALSELAAAAGGAAPVATEQRALPPAREHLVHVAYDGPDLAEVAAALGATPREVGALHAGRAVTVELLGFLPGFAYMGAVEPRLVRPRRASPRPIVPAGSVAVAGEFTGIYPFASPGGWTLLGRAVGVQRGGAGEVSPAVFFDPERDPPALFAPGDRVRFVEVAPSDAPPLAPTPGSPLGASGGLPARSAPDPAAGQRAPARALEIVAAPLGVTVQDAGRPGQLSKGLPPSGPLDEVTHAAANLAVGNLGGAAALEIPLGAFTARAIGQVLVSVDGEPARRLGDGEALHVPASARAVRYLAVRGGIAVPAKLGARATLLAVRLGGFEGRVLRRGDRVPVGDEAVAAPAVAMAGIEPAAPPLLEIDPAPRADRFPPEAMDALLSTTWTISRWGDRVGVRLEASRRIPREGPDLALPVPMVRGAVQVATDGTPIVLGPDHPVTGGYPVLAVVRRADQPRLARLRPGEEVRFRLGQR